VCRVRTGIPKPQPEPSKYPGVNPETAFCAGVSWSLVISATDAGDSTRSPSRVPPASDLIGIEQLSSCPSGSLRETWNQGC
jgi:hypothetical protein